MSSVPAPSELAIPATEEPFVLRAHHAREIFLVLALGQELGATIDDDELYARQHLPTAYYRDSFGDSKEKAEGFKAHVRNFFQAFLDLPPEANVKIVANQKDPICAGCAIGKHCDEWTKGDESWLRAVKTTAGVLGLSQTVEEGEDMVLRNDGSSRAAPTLTLPASTARAVYADIDFRSRTYPRFVQFLIRRYDKNSRDNQQLA